MGRQSLLLVLIVFLSSCTPNETAKYQGVLTVVVVGDRVLVGRARTFGTDGTFRIRSLEDEPIECSGRFRYTNPPYGTARFNCTNGERGKVRIEADGILTGTGKGTSSFGPVQIAFGYTLNRMSGYIKFPNNQDLALNGDQIKLVTKK